MVGTLDVGHYPIGISVNPATNLIYVVNSMDNSVSIIQDNALESLPVLSVMKTLVTNVFGNQSELQFSVDGKTLDSLTFMSSDGKLIISVSAKTQILDSVGKPATDIVAEVNENPPPLPSSSKMVGLAYNLGPPGTTFDLPITLICHYTHDQIPSVVNEADVYLAYYDENTQKWVPLPGTLDTNANNITVSIYHFSTYTMIASLTAKVSQPLDTTNTTTIPTKLPVDQNPSQNLSQEIAPAQSTSPAITMSEITNILTTVLDKITVLFRSLNIPWGLIGEIIGGLMIVILIAAFVINRRVK
jgi:DNA-binding beta-propeller fold protein YncE